MPGQSSSVVDPLDGAEVVADQRVLERLDDVDWVDLRAGGLDAAHGVGVEGDVECLVDGVEDGGDLLVVVEGHDAGDEGGFLLDALGHADEFPAVDLQRLGAGAKRVLGFAEFGVDAEFGEGVADVDADVGVALLEALAFVLDGHGAGEGDGAAGVGDGAAADVALDGFVVALPGGLAGGLVSVGLPVAWPESDLSVGTPDPDARLAGRGPREQVPGHPAVRRDVSGTPPEYVHVGVSRYPTDKPLPVECRASDDRSTSITTIQTGRYPTRSSRPAPNPTLMAVTLPAAVLKQYPRFSLYNSPYPAHDRGCAVDLYPDTENPGTPASESLPAPSPVAGEVLETRTVDAPPKPYAVAHDHLILVDTGAHVARILHVDPAVEAGDSVAIGDPLGSLVRSGFFAPWVDNHLHLGFRPPDSNPHRASGSLPLRVDPALDVRPLEWDGTGTVVAAGDTYALLDAPAHPAPGDAFVGVGARAGDGDGATRRVLDGGCRHYSGGGVLGSGDAGDETPAGPVRLCGQRVGTARGGHVDWDDVAVFANGERVTGLSLCLGQDGAFGAKLVCPEHDLPVGTEVRVEFWPTDEPTVLG